MNEADVTAAGDGAWKSLYLAGGVAALAAGLVFRRNLGPEAFLLTGRALPDSATGWFTLLRDSRLTGLVMLNLFDVVDYALVGLMFLALCVILWRYNRSHTLIATALGFAGIAVCFSSNSAVSMLSLSDQYAAATTDAQRSMLLAAGEAILATDNPGAYFQGTGAYMGFLLVAAAGLAFSLVMLQSGVFGRVTAYTGILAGLADLAFCVLVAFVPWTGLILVPLAGLLLMIWHILTGLKLIRLWRGAPEAMITATSNADRKAI